MLLKWLTITDIREIVTILEHSIKTRYLQSSYKRDNTALSSLLVKLFLRICSV